MSTQIGHFSLWGDFQIDEVTRTMGIEPSEVTLKGETLEGATSPAKVSTWDLHCSSGIGEGMQEQINHLLNVLSPMADKLIPLTSRFTGEINAACSCGDGSDVINLNREILQKLVALNLNLNCFYICDEDEDAN